ncbi:MAG: cellulase family glycosylhydrolase [Myxococcaceae bacterium]
MRLIHLLVPAVIVLGPGLLSCVGTAGETEQPADPGYWPVWPGPAVGSDGGDPDAGVADAGQPDAGAPDAGSADAGTPDTFCATKTGTWCRDSDTLVRCKDGGVEQSTACPAGCVSMPVGVADYCAFTDAGTTSCADAAVREVYGLNIDPANPGGNPSAAELRTTGVRWARVEWKQWKGYSFFDPLLADLRAGGVRVMLIVDYSSVAAAGKPASTASTQEWITYRQHFRTTTEQLAQHYGNGVDAWQIWNEPDLFFPGTGYDPGVPAAQFGLMLQDAAAVIRPHSSRPIITAGLASGDTTYLTQARQAASGTLPVDAVAVHPYGQRAPDDWPNPSWGFGNMSDLFDRYLLFGKPLWVSEIGTVDTANQAQYLTNVFDLVRTEYAGRVQRVFWFCWSDAMVTPYGVRDSSGQPKAAYSSYVQSAPAWAVCEGP